MCVESFPELCNEVSLFWREVIVPSIEFFQVTKIGKQVIGTNQAFVYLIEVFNEQIAPEVKLVEGFFATALLYVHAVEHKDEGQSIRTTKRSKFGDKVLKCEQARQPTRFLYIPAKDVLEKTARPDD